LSKLDLVKGLPVTKFVKDKICDACQLGKQTKSSFKKKKVISTSRPLELLHMDLFGPIRTASLSGKLYAFVIVDDYSRYTWILFLAHKNEAHKAFVKHCRRIQNEKKVIQLTMLEVIEVESLIIKILNYIVIKMVLDTIFQHLVLLNKME
jgi:hypothetical protein